jgi:hypothetical protein
MQRACQGKLAASHKGKWCLKTFLRPARVSKQHVVKESACRPRHKLATTCHAMRAKPQMHGRLERVRVMTHRVRRCARPCVPSLPWSGRCCTRLALAAAGKPKSWGTSGRTSGPGTHRCCRGTAALLGEGVAQAGMYSQGCVCVMLMRSAGGCGCHSVW